MDQVYFLEVETSMDDRMLNTLLFSIPDEKRERLLKYRFGIDRKIGLYSEILIRCLLCRRTGMGFSDINIKAGRTGKPYLSGMPGHEFNISHTRNAIAAALSDRPVGIDIEKIRDIDTGFAQHIFTDNELALLCEKAQDRDTQFFSLWTRKEAFMKYNGLGLSMGLKSFDVTCGFPSEHINTLTANDYIISVCFDTGFNEIEFIKITESGLIELWRFMNV